MDIEVSEYDMFCREFDELISSYDALQKLASSGDGNPVNVGNTLVTLNKQFDALLRTFEMYKFK